MKVAYVCWYYGKGTKWPYEPVHLVRLVDGRGLIRTTEQCRALGLCH